MEHVVWQTILFDFEGGARTREGERNERDRGAWDVLVVVALFAYSTVISGIA